MEKRVLVILSVILLFVVILSGIIVHAAANDSTNTTVTTTSGPATSSHADQAYQCLENLVKGNDKLSLQEAVFASLALGNKKELAEKSEREKGANCGPKSGCKI